MENIYWTCENESYSIFKRSEMTENLIDVNIEL
jgi:hypothetical protein